MITTPSHQLKTSQLQSADCLYVDDLQIKISGKKLFNPIRFAIGRGEIVVITGASGSGKSSLLHALLGLLPKEGTLSGQVYYHGKPLDQTRLKQLRGRQITYVPQQVTALDPLMKVGKQVKGILGSKKQQQALFKRYDLANDVANYYPFALSGGMARRVLLAGALITDPDLILADEPTNGLNAELIQEMIYHFKALKQQGKSLLIVTHDMMFAEKVADNIINLQPFSLVHQPLTQLSNGLLVKQTIPLALAYQLKVSQLTFGYPKQKNLFEQFNFQLSSNQIIGLSSPSGSGKTTLAKLLAGFLSPKSGTITVNHQPILLCHNPVQLIDQHPEQAVNPNWEIGRIIQEAGSLNTKLLQQLGIDSTWLYRRAKHLSGGELQRVCIARALHYRHTRFLIADEICSQLDPLAKQHIWRQLLTLCQTRHIGLLMISHDHTFLTQVCDKVIQIN